MEKNNPHSPLNPIYHPFYRDVLNLVVMDMPPPDQHIGIIKNLFRKPLLRIGDDLYPGGNFPIPVQESGNGVM
jgi:hypothetical protein